MVAGSSEEVHRWKADMRYRGEARAPWCLPEGASLDDSPAAHARQGKANMNTKVCHLGMKDDRSTAEALHMPTALPLNVCED